MARVIVVPGDDVAGKPSEFTYNDAGKTVSSVVGIYDEKEGVARVIPLNGRYDPHIDDYVVGIVTEPRHGGARVDVNTPFAAYLPTPRSYNFGDVITARVKDVDEVKSVILWEDRKVPSSGTVIEVSPVKVPRVIGKKNSMVDLLKQLTGCDMLVGKNGRIWMKGPSDAAVARAEKAVLKIAAEAHTPGLTERIKEYLSKE
ncbi:RNA-binding protein [Candidatus Micrarchaeota archaeon]|nr:RNA-binding protein [Candidatus Micrarchaeota archaeon]